MLSNEAYHSPGERQLLLRFWKSAGGFWKGKSAGWAWLLTVLLIATVLLQLLTQYYLNFWNRDFFNAVERKDGKELLSQALRFIPLAAASLSLAVFSVWGRMTLQRRWRAWFSDELYRYWLGQDRFVRLNFVAGDYQAPEYRIAEDVRLATDLPVDLVLGLAASLLTAATFIGILWVVGGNLTIDAASLTLTIPGYLVVAVVIYSIAVAAVTMLIGRRLTDVLEENKRAEAQLRAVGTHVRESGESTAPGMKGEDGIRAIHPALKAVISSWLDYCWQLVRLTIITHTNSLVTPVIGLLLCTPKYVAGTILLGEVVQAAAAFVVVQGACSWFTDNYPRLAEWAASANRVASLLLALDKTDPSQVKDDKVRMRG
ncbi:SbmA/BacA-like family transporter [Bradyrhizobium symbiodeficiens]|uniref:SbmA/BacA-like family transporter n=2 Tax=Bradyrhizobium symbiodeficiens TaxID=1404367 RepID=UPI000BA1BC81|nr:SbmA/BacA-like family transporter [Bradyrhizobium symbiodeficiens]AWM09016.1 ABC transporter [Bradyrhizobium symbiodeficiens]QIP02041.1 ABC transporter [Bradyrhizobium symbiodeficiens]